jgi:hypothetical protein
MVTKFIRKGIDSIWCMGLDLTCRSPGVWAWGPKLQLQFKPQAHQNSFSFFFFLVVLGFARQALCHLSHSLFCDGFFSITMLPCYPQLTVHYVILSSYIHGLFQYFYSNFSFPLLPPAVPSDRPTNAILFYSVYKYKYIKLYMYLCVHSSYRSSFHT